MPVTTHFLECVGECTGPLAQLAPLTPSREAASCSTSAHVLRWLLQQQRVRARGASLQLVVMPQ